MAMLKSNVRLGLIEQLSDRKIQQMEQILIKQIIYCKLTIEIRALLQRPYALLANESSSSLKLA